jgi:hypothetical protein
MDVEAPTMAVTPVVQSATTLADYGPISGIMEIRRMYQQVKEFISGELKDGEDYGITPGTQKPALWKPGAEKMCFLFALGIQYDHVAGEVTPARVSHTYKCTLVSLRTGQVKAMCEGSCNSDEIKYAKTLDKLRENYPQATALTLDNTIRKMAQKRSLVGATLNATGASAYFSTHTEGGEDEEKVDGNGHSIAKPKTKRCTIHSVDMRLFEKEGRSWYSHKTDDGKWCSGPKDEEPAATPAPAQPKGRGDTMNWIQERATALGWTMAELTKYVKTNYMRAGLSACTPDELSAIVAFLQGETPDAAPEQEAAQ